MIIESLKIDDVKEFIKTFYLQNCELMEMTVFFREDAFIMVWCRFDYCVINCYSGKDIQSADFIESIRIDKAANHFTIINIQNSAAMFLLDTEGFIIHKCSEDLFTAELPPKDCIAQEVLMQYNLQTIFSTNKIGSEYIKDFIECAIFFNNNLMQE